MSSQPTQPLMIVAEPPKQYQIRRELEHIHKAMNEIINAPIGVISTAVSRAIAATDSGSAVLVNSATSAISIFLPAPRAGLNFMVKDSGGLAATNNVTIVRNSTDLIDGAATKVISTNYGAVRLVADGSNWYSV